MKHLLALLICVVALFSASRADVLSPQAFTQEFARALAAALPSRTVAVKRDLELTVTDAGGGDTTIFLANPYNEYSREPARLAEIVQTFAAALSQSASGKTAVDRSRIIPVIKDRKWIADVHGALKARGVEQQHLTDDFNEQLIIVYAEDDPTRMRFLTAQEDIGVARHELRALAVENLRRILPKIEMRGDDKVLLVSAGGDYEASLLLIDEIWSGGQIKVNGDIVVAVPARDVLLVTGSRDRTGLKRVHELATKFVAEGPYGLTDALFVYRNGRFTKFGAK